MHNKFVYYTLFGIFSFLYPAKMYNRENFPKGKGIIVGNHFSVADPCFMHKLSNEPMCFLAKKEAIKNNLGGKILTDLGAIPVDRDHTDLKAMMTAIRELNKGYKLVVFPEGTRNKVNEELQELKGGAGVFAVKTKSPIIPIMCYKKAHIFRRTSFMVGKPFELTEFYDRKLLKEDFDKMNEIIREKMLETRAELLELKAKKVKNKKKCK